MTRHQRSISQIRRQGGLGEGSSDLASHAQSSHLAGLQRETGGDFPLPSSSRCHLRSYDRAIYGTWPSGTPIPDVGTTFSYWGRSYMLGPSTIPNAGIGLFTIDGIFVPPESAVTVMVFAGPEYTWGQWLQLTQYVVSMATYGMCSNSASLDLRQSEGYHVHQGERLFIDGRPYSQGNIAGFINSSRGHGYTHETNCIFEERTNVQEEFMSSIVDRCIMVVATTTILPAHELFVNYSFIRRMPARVRRQAAGLPIERPRRRY